MFKKYYLYRHIRLDTEVPFYIGIGTKPNKFSTYKSEYKRAFEKYKRNYYWRNIVNKHGYYVEIMMESNDYDFIKEKEKEFIDLYDNLANMTLGGDGCLGLNGKSNSNSKVVYQFDVLGNFIREWESVNLAAKNLNANATNICNAIKTKNKLSNGFRWSYDRNEIFTPIENNAGKYQSVKNGGVVKVDIFTKEITKYPGLRSCVKGNEHIYDTGKISNCCNYKRKSHKGCLWMWESDFLKLDVNNIIEDYRNKINPKKIKFWTIVEPNGVVYNEVLSLKQFCKDRSDINSNNLGQIALGRMDNYKGWKCSVQIRNY